MKIQTKFLGEVEIESNQTWSFPKGIPGFEDEKNFALLPIEGNDMFIVLQSINTKDIAFIVANPYTIAQNYSFDIDEATIHTLDIQNEEDLMVLGVLSLKNPFETSTINLQAPLIFNTKTKKGKQMILNDSNFSMRHQIGAVEESK